MRNLKQRVSITTLALMMIFGLTACPDTGKEVLPSDSPGNSGHLVLPNNLPDGGLNWSDLPSSDNDGGGVSQGSENPDGGLNSGNIFLENISPATGALAGGYRVRLNGFGFTPEMTVFLNGVAADQVLFISTMAATCRVPAGTTPGPADIKIVINDGWATLIDGFTYFSPIQIDTLTPNHGSTLGGTPITLAGVGFHEEMMVLIGDRQVADLTIVSQEEATLIAPPGAAGRHDVKALDTFGDSTVELGYTYVNELGLEMLSPSWNTSGDTTAITLTGSGFNSQMTASLDDVALSSPVYISESHMIFSYTSATTGIKALNLNNGHETLVLENAFTVYGADNSAPLSLDGLYPAEGATAGGESITLTGRNISNVTSVSFGDNSITGDDIEVINEHEIRVNAPGAASAGAVTVTVSTGGLQASLEDGYVYIEGLRIISIMPNYGPQEGGTEVTVQGEYFTSTMTVSLGGTEITDFTLETDGTITFLTPAGAPGYVDLLVSENNSSHLYAGAFYYDSELSLTNIFPTRGGMSGDTHVTIYGQGFQGLSSFELLIGGDAATDIEVLSDNMLYARTPPHEPGTVDVVLVAPQEEEVSLLGVYTYFDPTFIVGGTRGGAIEGAVYVTALDAMFGMPISGLTAWLGTTGGNQYIGITDMMGQATLSGPDVYGPQTISVGGQCWETGTVVDVNASEVTVYLQYICSGTPSAGGGGGGPPPATISGHITGFAKEFFDPAALGPDEIALAVVYPTSADEFSGIPNPGTANVVFEDGGRYFIAQSRVGRLAVVALAGVYNLMTNDFALKQMGVRRNVHPEFGVDLVDQDIELTIPLNQDIEFSMPDAPIGDDRGGCTITRVVPFLRFGGEGAFAYTSGVSASQNLTITNMPDVPGEMLSFIAGAFTTDGSAMFTDQGTAITTEGSSIISGSGTNWDETDFFGNPLVLGKIIVIERGDGTSWAATIVEAVDATTVRADKAVDFSGTTLPYHIGAPGMPKSEIVQDGTGSLLGGVTLQPIMGFPEPLSPSPQGVMYDRMLRWKAPSGQQPTFHRMYIYGFNEGLWSFYVEGARTKVPLPFIPEMVYDIDYGEDGGPPHDVFIGGYMWQHQAIYSPELEFSNFSYLDIGSQGRRSWSTQTTQFVFSTENP